MFCTGIAETAPVRVLYCCASEALPAAEAAELEQGPRSDFCKPAATGAGKISKRNPTHQNEKPGTISSGAFICPDIADAAHSSPVLRRGKQKAGSL